MTIDQYDVVNHPVVRTKPASSSHYKSTTRQPHLSSDHGAIIDINYNDFDDHYDDGPNHNSQRLISILLKRNMNTEMKTIFVSVDQAKATTHLKNGITLDDIPFC